MAGLPTADELRELHRIRFGRVILEICLLYFLILSAIQIEILANSFWIGLLMFILIGCFQNGMIAWVHEGSHSSFNRNKKINDQMADFIFGPFGISMDQYRWHHVAHHKYLGDPDQEIVVMTWTSLKGIRLWIEVLKHLTGFYAIQLVLRSQNYSKVGSKISPPPPRSKMSILGLLVGNLLVF